MEKAQKESSLEESYKTIMETHSFKSSHLFKNAKKDGFFESILRPDYSNYTTTSMTSIF